MTTQARFPRREGVPFAAGFGSAAACMASARVFVMSSPPCRIGKGPQSHGGGGDRGYAGVLTRNPLPEPDLFTTTDWLREAPFSLEELADWIPQGWRSTPPPPSSIGRNVTMFRVLMRWAGCEVNADRPVLGEAVAINATFEPDLLPYSEIRATAKSVERYRAAWAANGWHSPSWLALQSLRGHRGGYGRGRSGEPLHATATA